MSRVQVAFYVSRTNYSTWGNLRRVRGRAREIEREGMVMQYSTLKTVGSGARWIAWEGGCLAMTSTPVSGVKNQKLGEHALRWLRLSHKTFRAILWHLFRMNQAHDQFHSQRLFEAGVRVSRKSHVKSFTSNSHRGLHLARKNTRRGPWLRPPAAHLHQWGTRPSWRGCHVSWWRRQRRPWCQRFDTSLKHLRPRASPWLLWQWLWTGWDEQSFQTPDNVSETLSPRKGKQICSQFLSETGSVPCELNNTPSEPQQATIKEHQPVFGHSAFTAMPSSLNSSDIPRTHMDIPYLAIVYAVAVRIRYD